MSGIMLNIVGASTAAAGYAYVGMASNNSQTIYGGATVTGMTPLPTQPTNSTFRFVGLVADGSFIAQAGWQYSTNNGSSWAGWAAQGSFTPTGMPTGLNGSIAYNPTAKRAYVYSTEYQPKSNSFYANTYTVTSTGSQYSASGPGFGSSTGAKNVLYSPALNSFYMTNFGSSQTTWWSNDGTTGASGTAHGNSSCGNMIAGISHNGYPLQAAYAGFGTTFYLREYTTVDLSSYNNFGGFDAGNSYQIHSPFFWAPVNNKYIKAAGGSNSAPIYIYTATSSSPSSWSQIGSVSPSGAAGFTSANFIEQTNGTLWIFGQYRINIAKGGQITVNYTEYSTDGGVTWTATTGYLTLAKNFTP